MATQLLSKQIKELNESTSKRRVKLKEEHLFVPPNMKLEFSFPAFDAGTYDVVVGIMTDAEGQPYICFREIMNTVFSKDTLNEDGIMPYNNAIYFKISPMELEEIKQVYKHPNGDYYTDYLVNVFTKLEDKSKTPIETRLESIAVFDWHNIMVGYNKIFWPQNTMDTVWGYRKLYSATTPKVIRAYERKLEKENAKDAH